MMMILYWHPWGAYPSAMEEGQLHAPGSSHSFVHHPEGGSEHVHERTCALGRGYLDSAQPPVTCNPQTSMQQNAMTETACNPANLCWAMAS